MKFQGKTIVITGASSGIGKALAARCVAEGARVVAVSDRAAELEQTVVELASQGEIHPVTCETPSRIVCRGGQ